MAVHTIPGTGLSTTVTPADDPAVAVTEWRARAAHLERHRLAVAAAYGTRDTWLGSYAAVVGAEDAVDAFGP